MARLFIARPGNFGSVERRRRHLATSQYFSDIVGKLAIDPGNPLVIYSTDGFIRTAKSIDGGATWGNVGTGLPTAVAGFAIDPANSERRLRDLDQQRLPEPLTAVSKSSMPG